uniref:Protein kinase domain-containing protein n=1 Tax=Macrostomum lignano TaxID=282301 RepID=A0A1I8ILS9_9PLAT
EVLGFRPVADALGPAAGRAGVRRARTSSDAAPGANRLRALCDALASVGAFDSLVWSRHLRPRLAAEFAVLAESLLAGAADAAAYLTAVRDAAERVAGRAARRYRPEVASATKALAAEALVRGHWATCVQLLAADLQEASGVDRWPGCAAPCPLSSAHPAAGGGRAGSRVCPAELTQLLLAACPPSSPWSGRPSRPAWPSLASGSPARCGGGRGDADTDFGCCCSWSGSCPDAAAARRRRPGLRLLCRRRLSRKLHLRRRARCRSIRCRCRRFRCRRLPRRYAGSVAAALPRMLWPTAQAFESEVLREFVVVVVLQRPAPQPEELPLPQLPASSRQDRRVRLGGAAAPVLHVSPATMGERQSPATSSSEGVGEASRGGQSSAAEAEAGAAAAQAPFVETLPPPLPPPRAPSQTPLLRKSAARPATLAAAAAAARTRTAGGAPPGTAQAGGSPAPRRVLWRRRYRCRGCRAPPRPTGADAAPDPDVGAAGWSCGARAPASAAAALAAAQLMSSMELHFTAWAPLARASAAVGCWASSHEATPLLNSPPQQLDADSRGCKAGSGSASSAIRHRRLRLLRRCSRPRRRLLRETAPSARAPRPGIDASSGGRCNRRKPGGPAGPTVDDDSPPSPSGPSAGGPGASASASASSWQQRRQRRPGLRRELPPPFQPSLSAMFSRPASPAADDIAAKSMQLLLPPQTLPPCPSRLRRCRRLRRRLDDSAAPVAAVAADSLVPALAMVVVRFRANARLLLEQRRLPAPPSSPVGESTVNNTLSAAVRSASRLATSSARARIAASASAASSASAAVTSDDLTAKGLEAIKWEDNAASRCALMRHNEFYSPEPTVAASIAKAPSAASASTAEEAFQRNSRHRDRSSSYCRLMQVTRPSSSSRPTRAMAPIQNGPSSRLCGIGCGVGRVAMVTAADAADAASMKLGAGGVVAIETADYCGRRRPLCYPCGPQEEAAVLHPWSSGGGRCATPVVLRRRPLCYPRGPQEEAAVLPRGPQEEAATVSSSVSMSAAGLCNAILWLLVLLLLAWPLGFLLVWLYMLLLPFSGCIQALRSLTDPLLHVAQLPLRCAENMRYYSSAPTA